MPNPDPVPQNTTATLETVKPGHRTTEFYLNLGLTLIMAAIATGVVPQTGEIAKVSAFAVMAITNVIYMLSRASVKNTAATAILGALPDSMPEVPPVAGAGGSFALAAKVAPLLALFVLGAALAGCGASARDTALRTSLATTKVTVAMLDAYTAQHEDEIARTATSHEDGDAKLAAYEKKLAIVDKAVNVLLDAIATAAIANDTQSLAAIAPAALTLKQAFDDLRAATGGAK